MRPRYTSVASMLVFGKKFKEGFLLLGCQKEKPLNQALYVLEVTSPPVPVQLVWKNWPRGLSIRS